MIIIGYVLLLMVDMGYHDDPIVIQPLPNKQSCVDAGEWLQQQSKNKGKKVIYECKPIYDISANER